MKTIDIKKLLAELTLEEKAGLCSGADFWHTKAVERLGLPAIMVSDGPHGLRKIRQMPEQIGMGESIKAVCFPTAAALACSFDVALLYTLGGTLGEECQAEDVAVVLGPAVHMKRSPLCGRNFEYFSEDPYLAGELGASYVNGVQSRNVGTSVKHFAANNQETRRMSISAEVDERTLREIYLAAYETIVKKARPWTMMCSYNCINGVYSCENDWLLNKVLRGEWGFDGFVMTDWGAMNDRVKAVKAGLELEMPASGGMNDRLLVEAVNNGTLSIEVLDQAVERILTIVKRYYEGKVEGIVFDREEHHKLARKMAAECAVLLKNDGILPLKETTKVAFIGEFAVAPRYQGGGSSHINSFKVTNALDAAKGYSMSFAKGYEALNDEPDLSLIQEAVNLARDAEAAVIFAGLPDHYESEGYDRAHLDLPACQNVLIEEVLKVQPNTVVVLHNGSPVALPWVNKVKAILEVYLGGQAVGEATIDLLYGKANPCGKLAETFPLKLQDNPSHLNFPGTNRTVEYREGVFIGYRYYDAKAMDVLFPFGYGLSYTTFDYSDLGLKVINSDGASEQNGRLSMGDTDQLEVSLKVRNTGSVYGKEIVQLYVRDAEASVGRPPKELKGFLKVALAPGEEKTVTFLLDKRSFAYYSTDLGDWFAESGAYDILIGKSSREIVLEASIELQSSQKLPLIFDDRTTFADIMAHMDDPSLFYQLMAEGFTSAAGASMSSEERRMFMEIIKATTLHSARSLAGIGMPLDKLDAILESLKR
ncbi:MAG: glycoside hydrolase family 3 C-terminal domain-containing protein [Clostridia bacterium]|nr:glycoside hydrolase family 3 C-terminal domain-containing protein [Clostridia bacterium]